MTWLRVAPLLARRSITARRSRPRVTLTLALRPAFIPTMLPCVGPWDLRPFGSLARCRPSGDPRRASRRPRRHSGRAPRSAERTTQLALPVPLQRDHDADAELRLGHDDLRRRQRVHLWRPLQRA